MEPIYSAAKAIVNRAQPSLDGGILIFILNNFINFSPTDESVNITLRNDLTIAHHLLSTYARTGYSLGIVFGLIWIIILIISACIVCRQRKRAQKNSDTLLYLVGSEQSSSENAGNKIENRSNNRRHSPKSVFYRTRERLQSNWICLAVQFSLLSLFTILLGTVLLLGFSASGQFHSNLVSPPTYEESVGRLLTPAELLRTDPPKTHIFPRILRGLAQVRAYFDEFVTETKRDTEPIVNSLIQSTEEMQNRMTNQFNAILFERIGVKEAFELGDILGTHVISLMTNSLAIVKANNDFKDSFDRLKVEFQSWLRLINLYSPLNDYDCVGQCNILRSTFINNVSIRPDTFMPKFDFAIALKFVTIDQNQTAESVQAQLNQGKQLSDRQLEETKKIMAEKINIPMSIRNMTNKQWDLMNEEITKLVKLIDKNAAFITHSIVSKVGSGSSMILALNIFFWLSILIITLGLLWLIIHYHCVPNELSLKCRNRVRLFGLISFIILIISMFSSIMYFLLGGYLQTELCRYLDPGQNTVNVAKFDLLQTGHTHKYMFPIDAHINAFLSHNWQSIEIVAKKMSPPGKPSMPIPHIRSPVYAIAHNCKENMGLLEAMDAIRDFDMNSLNDPQMSERFINIGKDIMIDSLKSINIDEMFPKETDEQLAMAARLDDFIVNFNQIRSELPNTYLSIQSPTDESGNYTLWSASEMWNSWDIYQSDILRYRLSVEQINKLNVATQKVHESILYLDSLISNIDANLIKLSGSKKIAPYVIKLQNTLEKLKVTMTNKPDLINIAMKLFDEQIRIKTPEEAKKLIIEFGPKIMGQVGKCKRLYEALQDLKSVTCDGFVSILNGFWFLMGWVSIVGTLTIIISLLLLLHKSPITQTTGKSIMIGTLNRRNTKSTDQPPTACSELSDRFGLPSELQALNKPTNTLNDDDNLPNV